MKYHSFVIVAFISLLGLNISAKPAIAAAMNMSTTVTQGDIAVSNAWSRASAGMTQAGAAFMTVTNSGGSGDRLIAATTVMAERAELHTHLMEAGVMKMRQVMNIEIPAGQAIELKPGGNHVMLFKLSEVFQEGGHYPLTLTFEKAGDLTLMVHIVKAGAMENMTHGSEHAQ